MNLKKFLILNSVVLVAGSSFVFGTTYEYPQLYKDPKVLGMGGANVAVGGSFSSLFYNPAGLSKIPKEHGWEIELLNLSLATDKNVMDFIDDLDAASDVGDLDGDGDSDNDETKAINEVLEKYAGDNMHVDLNLLMSMSKKFEEVAFGVGGFASLGLNYKAHQGFGSDGFLSADALGVGGVVAGASKDYKDVTFQNYVLNNFSVGAGMKILKYAAISHDFSVNEISEYGDNLDDYIDDADLLKEGSSTVLDLGAQYEVGPDFYAGASILNIGGVGDSSALEVPMTVNIGVGYLKRFEDRAYFNQVRFAADYIDLFYGYDQDEDFIKRTRLGAEVNAWDGWLSSGVLRAGFYQGNYTFGVDVRLSVVNLSYATYEEEVGAYSGQDSDRRHIVNLTIGW
jgi:hypothetical protein